MIYLDNASTSFPKPGSVYEFMDAFFRRAGVNPGRGGYDMCREAGDLLDATRRLLTEFFNGTNPDRLCFGHNSTDALNLAIFGLLKKGDHAVTTTLEHNAVLRPLYHLEKYGGVEVDRVPFDAAGFVHPEDIARRFKRNTRLVVVNHASNVIGTVQPVREIGRLCRERGVLLAVDASQTAGKRPIDVRADNIDVLAFTGHKSLLGPTGIGGLVVGEGVTIRHTRAGGTGIRSADRLHLEEYPYRLEYGTPNIMGVAGLNAGVKWVMEQGLEALEAREMDLTTRLRDGLRAIEGTVLYCQDDLADHLSVLSFNLRGMEAGEAGGMLDTDYGIACRAGLHCAPLVHEQLGTDKAKGSVRFGIGPFNTEDDIRAAVEAVAEVAEAARQRRGAQPKIS
ncbi:MAG: aminotransferase class V-fold PLP-dependent enzyme [Candidatus Aminicenantes bacterium]|nr:aminotransferase class V-fold PLP-dependent enzyme [Candidatus Aminicenantes bacterium]